MLPAAKGAASPWFEVRAQKPADGESEYLFSLYARGPRNTRPQESLAMTDVRNSFGGTYLLACQKPEGIITITLRRNSKKLDNTKTPSPPSRGS